MHQELDNANSRFRFEVCYTKYAKDAAKISRSISADINAWDWAAQLQILEDVLLAFVFLQYLAAADWSAFRWCSS